jgi:hypothetical protein
VTANPIYRQTVRTSAQEAATIRGLHSQEITLRSAIDGVLNEQQAQAAANALTTNLPLGIQIVPPAPDTLYAGFTPLVVRISGANATFVQPTLGVPPRLSILFNGRDQQYEPDFWREDGDSIVFEGRVTIPQPIAPLPFFPVLDAPLAWQERRLASGVGVTVSTADAGLTLVAPVAGRAGRLRTVRTLDGPQTVGGQVPFMRLAETLLAQGAGTPSTPAPIFATGAVAVSGGRPIESDAPWNRLTLDRLTPVPLDSVPIMRSYDGVPTLMGIAGMNALQVSVADGMGRTDSASVVFFMEPGRTAPTGIRIDSIDHNPPGPDARNESILLRADGPEPVALTGWTLRDLARHIYTFPEFTLQPGQGVRIWTGTGNNDAANLYWGRRAAVWNNRGDTAVLTDVQGGEVDRYTYAGVG